MASIGIIFLAGLATRQASKVKGLLRSAAAVYHDNPVVAAAFQIVDGDTFATRTAPTTVVMMATTSGLPPVVVEQQCSSALDGICLVQLTLPMMYFDGQDSKPVTVTYGIQGAEQRVRNCYRLTVKFVPPMRLVSSY